MTRAWRRRAGWIALALWVSCGAAQALVVKDYEPTGPQPSVVDEKGERRALYKQSHALLISVSDYLGVSRKGWRSLPETRKEMDAVAKALLPHGFRVRRVSDPNGVELETVIKEFVEDYGRDPDHRLMVFFSGHGYTDPDTNMGYLVPTDALNPEQVTKGFYTKAMSIKTMETTAYGIRARHAMFLFDSCFSGSIFETKSAPTQPDPRGTSVSERWRFLTQNAAKPVRQFIAAGGPKEPLPAQSQFVPLFIEALDGRGSRVGDGYVTGKELGSWLEQTLPRYNADQNPHSDVINNSKFMFGDMVFQVPGGAIAPVRPPEPPIAMVVKDYEPTGPQPSVMDEKGVRRDLYKQSHALLISVSNYLGLERKGWDPLKQTGHEMDQVAEVLRPHGFRVRRVSDPNGVELQAAIQKFLAEYGRDENHRLLVFFSGHGYTDRVTDMSYLVPTDALDPNLNPQGFFSKALPIESLQTSARSIRARHAIFLFDSSFSGGIFSGGTFKSKAGQPEPRGASVSERFRFLTEKAAKPVRQFIAAGGPEEELPAQSQFVPLFIQALSGSGSRVGDGYVTGKELGQWLEQTLPSYNRHQNPHSDVIKVPQLSFGDVVFQVPGAIVPVPVRPPESPVVQAETRSAPPADPFPPGKRFRDCEDAACPWMVVVPAGSFMMGSPANEPGRDSDEGPQHRVSISKFAMGQFEVTQGQWTALMGSNPSHFKDCGYECPVEQVNWNDAQEFVKKLNEKTGKVYRLPSEAEWEYAARAGTTTYSFGARLSTTQVNCSAGASGKTVVVGRYPANPFGLSDMHGNVYEWTGDWFAPYQAREAKDPVVQQDKKESRLRVLRGGGSLDGGRSCRSADRDALEPAVRDRYVGFRLVRGLVD